MERSNVFLTDVDRYLFGNGTHYEIYEKMGAHQVSVDGQEGIYFAVWAPHAQAVYVVGDFNDWNTDDLQMEKCGDSGIFELFTNKAHLGDKYKYLIRTYNGDLIYKADPYANYSELRPGTASIITDINGFEWTDSKWITKKSEEDTYSSPMSIYEVHLGSWKKHQDEDSFYTYRELAHELADYVSKTGYTHIELIGIAEYPYDGSWGYQVTGYYEPTSRYGMPKDFMYFINYMHSRGIGVILDWVPAHFPKDAHGLANFDGTSTYEYADPRMGEHPEWGTKIFDYSKHEVTNFLIANALFWIEKYHIDGLRVDAVASMLYLDYGKEPGCWVPNRFGGNGNLDAVDFFRHLNSVIKKRDRRAITIAEESTTWPKVTDIPENDGLGFTYKWNMGWMHDFIEYIKLDPYFRKFNHYKMTFAMSYAYSEKYILVLSHDEVVHLKCSMLGKMPGEYDDKFANLKVAYAFMMGHPGKKLLFMGQDFGQWSEWDEKKELDWYLLNEYKHNELYKFYKKLIEIYSSHKACYELDYDPDGFRWINADDCDRSIYSFVRKSKSGRKNLVFIFNFTPVERKDYIVGVPSKGNYKLILDEKGNSEGILVAEEQECDGLKYSLTFDLPPYGIRILEFNNKKESASK